MIASTIQNGRLQHSFEFRGSELAMHEDIAIHFKFPGGVVDWAMMAPNPVMYHKARNNLPTMIKNIVPQSVIANFNHTSELVSVIIFTSAGTTANSWIQANPRAFERMSSFMANYNQYAFRDLDMLADVATAAMH